ncbi:uncharacterized protein N7469_003558 [Penicillium citrinum]|uniref:1,3-beta-glucanosyltransferase n=1 Tax=Penicillium citrinum TaxID=5077 RepID=A0A9W9P3E8_PENCI|nr:uncharacterized protein N7469_003558 [Penicillium citrinum]KAJ5234390.1 hypothetical protein N7469_003558 [Penicillium citrinum]KAK5801080.1 hypothetical protein VI817_003292 [Penicillium citrinum]
MKFSLLAGLSLVGTALAKSSIPSIEVKGKKFFYSNNGTEFFIRGVAYQANFDGTAKSSGSDSYVDPLVDAATCKRDIPYLLSLRTNVVRTYAINPNQSHDDCMNALADAGIYVISDLSAPEESIVSANPEWNAELFTRYSQVVDTLAPYPNVIGFFAGNEVSDDYNNTASMAYVKAAVRDMKTYIKDKKYRSSLAVGYATDDNKDVREDISNYLVCDSADDSIDFFGYNIYEFCGDSSFQQSGYKDRTEEFKDYPVPAFFSEYGCVQGTKPRPFDDVPILFGDQMNDVWSGGIVYMYFETGNHYGLVSTSGSSVSKKQDFDNLSSQMKKVSATGVNSADYKVSTTVGRSCPTVDSNWMAASKLPPSPNSDLCECMYDSLECVPNDDISNKDIKSTYNYLYGLKQKGEVDAVSGVYSNATEGTYGAYSMCNAKQRLAWAMNRYAKKAGGSSACDFDGKATSRSAKTATGSCATQMSSIGEAGTKTINAGLAASSGAANGSGGGSGSSATSSGVGVGMNQPQAVHVGAWQLGAYTVAAVASGIFMIML